MSFCASSLFSTTTDKRVAEHVVQVARDALALGELGDALDLFLRHAQLGVAGGLGGGLDGDGANQRRDHHRRHVEPPLHVERRRRGGADQHLRRQHHARLLRREAVGDERRAVDEEARRRRIADAAEERDRVEAGDDPQDARRAHEVPGEVQHQEQRRTTPGTAAAGPRRSATAATRTGTAASRSATRRAPSPVASGVTSGRHGIGLSVQRSRPCGRRDTPPRPGDTREHPPWDRRRAPRDPPPHSR